MAAALLMVITCPAQPAGALDELDPVAVIRVPALDLAAIQAVDSQRDLQGLPPRFAIPNETLIRPDTHGTWQDLDAQTRVWRLRISSPGALSLNLGFTGYWMPPYSELRIYAADGSYALEPFTAADNEMHGELWTPVVLSDDIVVELRIPRKVQDELVLELTSINVGYRLFGEPVGDRSGYCNIDVVCPEGDDWWNEIPSVGVISTGGSTFCTGFMVNNTSQDQTPYFMTANHCGINSGNAASLVVYWNFQSPSCGQQGGGSLSQNQTGSYFRATYSTSDFTLVELDEDPNPAYNVTFAGWDRSTANPTSAVAIHHPSTDEKSISFEYDPCTTTSYLGTSTPGDSTHIRVTDWDLGTTEPGSSGSPLFDQNHHVVGQLHGGYAACGNDESDWYGRFSRSWTGGGSSSTRLSNWLDQSGTGWTSVDTLVPGASGLKVTPSDGLDSAGDPGGPFTPSSKQYTLENQGSTGFNYSVTKSQTWVSISTASGYLPGGGSAYVTVSINSNANALGVGSYSDTVNFINTTDHTGDTTRAVTLQVGGPSRIYNFPMDSNPGWSTEGQWAFGQPTGQGGEYGSPDPTTGHTGSYVYGYNLSGDYANDIPEYDLTSPALDCSDLSGVTLKFWRWLGVERNSYDHAYVRVSNNGSTWTTIWENGTYVEDSAWVQQEFDISGVADGQANVYLRWTIGTTDGSWRYCGWNIDDVEVWGISQAPAILGACCQPNGTCTVTEEVDCSATWLGEGTICSPNPCPQPQGACCYADGSCTVVTEAACSGTWLGAGTVCTPNPCPQPDGACCHADGSCTYETDAECSGTWLGYGSACDPNPCPQPSCLGDSNCSTGTPTFEDISYFVAALAGESAWDQYYRDHNGGAAPLCGFLINDMDGGGHVDFEDIVPFANAIGAACQPYAP